MVALLFIFGQTAFDFPADRSRRTGWQPLGFVANDCRHCLRSAVALERTLAGDQLVKDQAEHKLIAANIDFFAEGLLRTHI